MLKIRCSSAAAADAAMLPAIKQDWSCAGSARRPSVAAPRESGVRTNTRKRHVACSDAAAGALPGLRSQSEAEPSGRREHTDSQRTWAKVRGTIFLTLSMAIATPLFTIMLITFPLVWLFDRHRRRFEHWVNKVWAWCSVAPFHKVQVRNNTSLHSVTRSDSMRHCWHVFREQQRFDGSDCPGCDFMARIAGNLLALLAAVHLLR